MAIELQIMFTVRDLQNHEVRIGRMPGDRVEFTTLNTKNCIFTAASGVQQCLVIYQLTCTSMLIRVSEAYPSPSRANNLTRTNKLTMIVFQRMPTIEKSCPSFREGLGCCE